MAAGTDTDLLPPTHTHTHTHTQKVDGVIMSTFISAELKCRSLLHRQMAPKPYNTTTIINNNSAPDQVKHLKQIKMSIIIHIYKHNNNNRFRFPPSADCPHKVQL